MTTADTIWWHVYPLGFTGAPIRPASDDERALTHRLGHLTGWLDHLVGLGWWAWMIPLRGGDTSVCCTGEGMPLSCSVETSASPVPSSWIACSVLNAGFARMVCAAVFTAFWSFGVKARRACCTRLPS